MYTALLYRKGYAVRYLLSVLVLRDVREGGKINQWIKFIPISMVIFCFLRFGANYGYFCFIALLLFSICCFYLEFTLKRYQMTPLAFDHLRNPCTASSHHRCLI